MADPKANPIDVKHDRDRKGEIYQDALTENESKARGSVRDEAEGNAEHLDPDIENVEPKKR